MTTAPIAVITHRDDPNRFHRYVEEILLAEGYPWYRTCTTLPTDRLRWTRCAPPRWSWSAAVDAHRRAGRRARPP